MDARRKRAIEKRQSFLAHIARIILNSDFVNANNSETAIMSGPLLLSHELFNIYRIILSLIIHNSIRRIRQTFGDQNERSENGDEDESGQGEESSDRGDDTSSHGDKGDEGEESEEDDDDDDDESDDDEEGDDDEESDDDDEESDDDDEESDEEGDESEDEDEDDEDDDEKNTSKSVNHNDVKSCSDLESVLEVREEILENLECPVCYEHIQPPVWRCQNKHKICNSCLHQIGKTCPLCRVNMILLFDEDLMETYKTFVLPCGYSSAGCPVISSGEKRKLHISQCEYQTVRCPLRRIGCNWSGIYADFKEHCFANHASATHEIENTANVNRMTLIPDDSDYQILFFENKCYLGICHYDAYQNISWRLKPYSLKSQQSEFWFAIGIYDISRLETPETSPPARTPIETNTDLWTDMKRQKVTPKKRNVLDPEEWFAQFWARVEIPEWKANYFLVEWNADALETRRRAIERFGKDNVICYQWAITHDENLAKRAECNLLYTAKNTLLELD